MKYFFANWKMYLDLNESVREAKTLCQEVRSQTDLKMAVFPSTLAFFSVEMILRQTVIAVGAQNVFSTPKGAYTGAVSANLFAEAGAKYALVGHSERRHIFAETDEDVHKKFLACLSTGITPILCIGETKDDAQSGKRQYRLKKQLLTAIQDIDLSGKSFFIAYEPVWAIGTNKPCSPSDVEDVHGWLRLELQQYTLETVPILYGGSVDAKNVRSFVYLSCVDGVLVGSASIHAKDFLALVDAITSASET